MSKIQINHNLGVNDVRVKIGNMSSVTDVKQVKYKNNILWCRKYMFYLPQVNPNYIKSVTLYRQSTEEPTIYTGETSVVSPSGTTSYVIGNTTYANTPYYQTYFNDKIYINTAAKDTSYSGWYNGSETISTPSISAPTLSTTGDATSPNITITNPNNFEVNYVLYYGTTTDAPVASGTLKRLIDTRVDNLESGTSYLCVFTKTWYRDKTTYSASVGNDPNNGNLGTSSSYPWTIQDSAHFIVTGSSSTTTKAESNTQTANASKQPAARNTYAVTFDASKYCSAYTSTSASATSGNASGYKYPWGTEISYCATLNNNDNDYYYTPASGWGLIGGRSYLISGHLIQSATKLNAVSAVNNKYNYSVGATLSNAAVNWYSDTNYSTALGKVQTGATIYLKVNPNTRYQTTVGNTRYYNGNPYQTSVTFNGTNFTLSPDKSTPDSTSSAAYKSFPSIVAISYQPSSTNTNCSVSWTKATYDSNTTGTITPSSYYYSSAATIVKAINTTNFTVSDANATAIYGTGVSCSPITYTIKPTSETGGTIGWSNATLKKGTTESSKLTLTPTTGFRLRSGVTSGNTISWNSFSFNPVTSTNNISTGTAIYSLDAFEAIPYTLTIGDKPVGCSAIAVSRSTVGTAGIDAGASTGTLSNGSTIYYGDKLSVSATASAVYYNLSYSSSITVDGNETVSVTSSYKTYPLNIVVPANCSKVQYSYKKEGSSTWTSYVAVSANTTVNIEYNAQVRVAAIPADGYTADYPISNPYEFTMGTSGYTFTPVISITAYTLTVIIGANITSAYVDIQRGDLGWDVGASNVGKTITSTSSYSIYRGDSITVSNITANTGYHPSETSYSYTVTSGNITVEPTAILNTYIFAITKGTGISTVYYKANGASSYTSSTSATTNVVVNHGSTIYVYGAAITGSSYLPCAYTSSSPYSKTITGDGSITMSANSIAKPVLTREGNAYKTQFKVTNNNPYAMTFYYGTSAGATTYSASIAANSSAYIDSSVSEGNTVYGKFYYSGTTGTSGNNSLALGAIDYSTYSTATTTGSQVTISVAADNTYVDNIEVGYGASNTWSTTITSNATTSSGWSKSFTTPSTSATYFHYRKKGYATKYNRFSYTMSKLAAPTLDYSTSSGTVRIINNSGITADVYHSLNSTYGSGTLIKSSLATGSSYTHSNPTTGSANFYYLKPNSNSCRFNSDKTSVNVAGSSLSVNASLYIYNPDKDDERKVGDFVNNTSGTTYNVGTYPYFDGNYGALFRIKYNATSPITNATLTTNIGSIQLWDDSNGVMDFMVEGPGSNITLTLKVYTSGGNITKYIKVSGNTDGWPD